MPFQCPRCHAEIDRNFKACPHCGEPITDFQRRYADEPIDGKYRIVERLGTGGMGEVYKVEHTYLGTTRVVKVIRPQIAGSADANDRFLREARLATRVQHPNVATLHDFSGLPDGSHYMVWEFIEGENVAQLLRKRGTFPPRLAIRLAAQAAHGLEAIHRAGIVHRDISPENLMVTGGELVKIIDLGVAKSEDLDHAVTKTGIFIGKIRYASPEHLGVLDEGQRIDGRADIYSLGVVLYEMLTGRPPFEATSPHQYLMHHSARESQVMPLPELPPQMPAALQTVLRRALERNRDRRFATAAEFASALEEVERTIDASSADATIRMTPAPAPAPAPPPAAQTVIEKPSRAPVVVIALLFIAFAGVLAALLMKPKAQQPQPQPIVSAPVTTATTMTTTAAAAPPPVPAQSTIEVKEQQVTPPPPVTAQTQAVATPAQTVTTQSQATETRGERTSRPLTTTRANETSAPFAAPQPAASEPTIAPYIEGGDGDANDAAIVAAQRALAGTKRVAVRGSDATLTAELARIIERHDVEVADDAKVVIRFDGALERLGRGRKRRSASASIVKNGRTVFRYELKPEEYRVGDDPAEAFARILGDVLR
jgi:serine/threonine protein kinase